MKLRRIATALGAAALLTWGSAGQSWASTPTVRWTTGAPGPVTGLTLPMSVDAAPDASGIYFAYYTTLESGTRPYAGFQPKPAVDGKSMLLAIFSSFNAKATTADSNCRYGADGGAGVSCAVQFPYTKGKMYSIVLDRVSDDGTTQLMNGDVVDTATGTHLAHIGSFRLPVTSGRFKPSDQGFVEPYLPAGCAQQVTVTYGQPIGREGGTSYNGDLPSVTDPASGSCLSSTSTDTSAGRKVTVTGDTYQPVG
ncbi:hypothetical protein AB0L33_33595 [Streptomyces sp. NPDC052299]|uniref:DUF3472 domain-containing protein n=1 Tax=Streptomyces sp. NPDC052299 TaxID=3155054 RepID=UPI0034297A89